MMRFRFASMHGFALIACWMVVASIASAMIVPGALAAPSDTKAVDAAQPAVDALVAALRTRDIERVKPFLSPSCTAGHLSAEQFARIFPGVIQAWDRSIANYRIEHADNGDAVLAVDYDNGKHSRYAFKSDGQGRFVELNLFQVQEKKINQSLTFIGPDATTLPLVPYGELWAVRATLDGKQGFWLIDSGAPLLVINRKAPAIDDSRSMAVGVAGSVTGAKTLTGMMRVGHFEWGDQCAADLDAMTMDLSHLQRKGSDGETMPIAGLIGKRELAAFESRFDFRNQRLVLVKIDDAGRPRVPRPSTLSEVHAFSMRAHLPLFEFTIGDAKTKMMFDTGASSNLMHEKYRHDNALRINGITQDTLAGATTDTKTITSGKVDGLRIDGQTIPPMHTAFAASVPYPDTDGIVGLAWVDGRPFALNYVSKVLAFGAKQ